MQAWGTRSRFDDRDTEAEASKSGVLGLCAAALGIDRAERVDDLTRLRFGVRVDREGGAGRDYHTAQLRPGDPRTKTDVTTRYYLADAAFWVGLEGDDTAFLNRLYGALQNPHWPLSLGRKAFQASLPIFTGPPLESPLWEALQTAPSLRRQPSEEPYRFVLDREAVPTELRAKASPSRRQDVPDGPFVQRRYLSREVLTLTGPLNLPTDPAVARRWTEPEEAL